MSSPSPSSRDTSPTAARSTGGTSPTGRRTGVGRLSLMIDLERCIGCKSCEAACKQEHGLGPGEYRNKVVWLGVATRPALDFLTVTCQHCEPPPCLRTYPRSQERRVGHKGGSPWT